MSHVVLLGDSIFDNRAYVTPRPDVIHQLRSRLGLGWTATLLAVDGHVTEDVWRRQLARLPGDASHIVISVGGNDALRRSAVLSEPAGSVADAVERLARAQADFAHAYEQMADAVLERRLPTTLCTIYDSNYPEPGRRVVVAALALFNDIISRVAFARRLPLIDLRIMFSEPADYANPIEPSAQGGDKIAAVIAALVRETAGANGGSTVWT